MSDFISEYIGSIVVGLLLLGIVAAIAVKLVRDKRKGKPLGCDCGCENCPKSSSCRGD